MENGMKENLVTTTYQYFKELGICVTCHSDYAMIGSVRCPECADKAAERVTARHEKLKASSEYSEYRKNRSAYQKQLRWRRRNAGICNVCGKHPAEKDRARCYECLIKRRRNWKKLDIPRNARPSFGLCYICGDSILFGMKVCLKHYERILTMVKNAQKRGGQSI